MPAVLPHPPRHLVLRRSDAGEQGLQVEGALAGLEELQGGHLGVLELQPIMAAPGAQIIRKGGDHLLVGHAPGQHRHVRAADTN